MSQIGKVSTGGGASGVLTLTGDTGGAVSSTAGNINVIADVIANNAGSSVKIVGNPGTSTLTLDVTDSKQNTFIGQGSGNATVTGTQNAALGYQNLPALTTGGGNVAVGYQNMSSYTDLGPNVALGYQCMQNAVSGFANIAIGYNAIDGTGFTGSSAGNIGIGERTLFSSTTTLSGSDNIAIGRFSGQSLNTTSNNNISIGQNSMVPGSPSTCTDNIAIGQLALNTSGTVGNFNIAIGNSALDAVGNLGSYNIGLGVSAGTSLNSGENSNILISNAGVSGQSNTIHIGTSGSGSGQQNKCFIAGIRGITTGNNNAVAVLIDSAGQLGTVSSSARYKNNIEDLGSLSENIFKLRPVQFNYKDNKSEKKNYGLIAEEVADILPEIVVYQDGLPETVQYHELPIMMLNEIQKLRKEVNELKARLP